MGRLRLFLILLMVDWVFGIPGVGVELVAALALTWFRQAWAKPLAMAVGAAAVVLAIADMVGLTSGQPAPAAMVAVDVGGIVIGAVIVWAARRSRRSTPLTA
jgi:hypothetical protein